MKSSTKQWLEYAARDLKAAELTLEDSYIANISLYHCQQAIEKSLKALLEEESLRVPKIHSVTTLYEKLPLKVKEKLQADFNNLSIVDDIYLDVRYPAGLGLLPDGFPTAEQAREVFDFCSSIFDAVNNYLHNK